MSAKARELTHILIWNKYACIKDIDKSLHLLDCGTEITCTFVWLTAYSAYSAEVIICVYGYVSICCNVQISFQTQRSV